MNKKLISILGAFAFLLGVAIWLGAAPPDKTVLNVPGITVGVLTKVLKDPGTGLEYNGAPISGAFMVGTVSNAVVTSDLLAVDATKTNAIAATEGMITNKLHVASGTQASGLLSAADWTTFNGKQAAGTYVQNPITADVNAGGFSITNAASVVVGGSGASTFSGGVEVTTATAGAIAMFGSVNKDLTNATAAAIEAALGQVYQGTNTVLTQYATIPTNTFLNLATGGTIANTLHFSGTASLLDLPSLTTSQKNAASAVAGSQVYDSDLGRVQMYDGAAWHSRVRLDGDTMLGNLAASMAVGNTTYIDVSTTMPASRTNAVSGDMTFSYVTNGVDGADVTKVCWFFNNSGVTKTLNFPVISSGANGWRTNVYGNMAAAVTITNATILKLVINCGGPTGSLALQTNVYASIEYYQ